MTSPRDPVRELEARGAPMAGAKRNGWGPFALLGRIPLVVRVLTVIASLIASGWVARDRVGLLQAGDPGHAVHRKRYFHQRQPA